MKKTILISLILCMLLAAVACQPTPTEEAVINRADGALEKAVRDKPVDPYTYEAPERWTETYKIREQEVRIDAQIEVPDADRFPVTTIKQSAFTPNDAVSFLQGFVAGEWTIRENEYSREELTVDLKNAAKGVYMGEDDETGEIIWQPDEAEMQRIQKLIEEAPVVDTFVPIKAEKLAFPMRMKAVKDSAGTLWYFTASRRLDLSLSRYRDGNIQMENWVMQGDATPGERPHALENIKISEEDAIKKGDEVVAALGLQNFRIASAQRARETQSYSYTVLGEGYYLTYVPTLPGATACSYYTYSEPDFMPSVYDSGMTYAPSWRLENVEMFVTDEGVLFLGWGNPMETVLTANENVQLMPFADIQKSLKKLIEYCTGGGAGSPILIKRIMLTSAIAQIPDQGDEAFRVPAWAFFITTEQNEKENIDMQLLLINALDGTLIRRSLNDDGFPEG